MAQYILAHDLGTTGNKATLYDLKGQLRASVLFEYPTFFPGPNYVEQNPEDWWKAVCGSTRQLLEQAGVQNSEVAAISFSAQMMGCLVVDAQGEPLRNMITWADMRSTKQAAALEKELGMDFVYRTTGHRLSASYSACKLLWIRDNEPEVYGKAAKLLHAKDYIIYRLTGEFVTDYSDASGMNMFDLNTKDWSDDILKAMKVDRSLLPELHASADVAGKVSGEAARATGLLEGTPVVIGGGDGSCACVGAGVVSEGKTYNVIGSSSWISRATRAPVYDESLRTFNWVHLDPDLFTPCGTMQTAGYSLNWLKNTLCDMEVFRAKEQGVNPYKLIDELIQDDSKPGANGLLFLPYLLGERSPRWNPDAKGGFLGLTVTSTKADIFRSVLEGVGYNLKVILDVLGQSAPIDQVIAIGGGAKGKVWLQILADIWQKPLLVPRYLEEATSMGAAICGGVGVGAFSGYEVISELNPIEETVQPRPENAAIYSKMFDVFNSTYDSLLDTFSKLSEIQSQ